jgi:hypothetical protein
LRLTSDIYVSALIRRVFSAGGFAAVTRRGAEQAGAVFVILRDRTGEVTLFGPSPQSAYEEAKPLDRAFVELMRTQDPETLDARLEREKRFDPDLWIVELEPGGIAAAELFTITKP